MWESGHFLPTESTTYMYWKTGHSTQSEGMVRLTLAELRPWIKREAAKIARQKIVKVGRGRS